MPARAHVLPDLPFNSDCWGSVDADVTLKAATIRRAKELPLDDLDLHLKLHDSFISLDPLNFGLAGGQLHASVLLDGRKNPIEAHATLHAARLLLPNCSPRST
jgi:uncharacterized protein involved in outer membrane biogenesis